MLGKPLLREAFSISERSSVVNRTFVISVRGVDVFGRKAISSIRKTARCSRCVNGLGGCSGSANRRRHNLGRGYKQNHATALEGFGR